MITLFQVDKSGSEIFEKDYSISLIKNKEEIYGVNIPQKIREEMIGQFNRGELNIQKINLKKDRLRFKIRFHTAIIILLLQKAIKDEGYVEEVNIQVCNDIDGHFHEIREMLFAHLSKLIPLLKKEDIVQTRFSKDSLVDIAAKNLREKNHEIKDYNILNINLEELINIIKK